MTLIGRDVKIRIAFEGQSTALKHFSAMLVPAWKEQQMEQGSDRTGGGEEFVPNGSSGSFDSTRGLVSDKSRDAHEDDDDDGPISHPVSLMKVSRCTST